MGQKRDLSDFECGMFLSARQAGLRISETADLLCLQFADNSQKKRKYPVSSTCVDENALLT